MRVRAQSERRKRRAFTLLEVLMVIVILGILAAAIVPAFMGTEKKARIDTTYATINGLDSQLKLFRLHCGRFPTTEEGLAVLLQQPDDEVLAEKWAGPYLEKVPRDAWGNELIYESPGTYNEETYDLSSPGPNGQPGDDDDITNWEKT
jgi:general secretion pathway protein G